MDARVWKRLSSGDGPGLQNRRAAPLVSPVRSTRTRFRHFKPAWLLKICTLVPSAVLDAVLACGHDPETPSRRGLRPQSPERLPILTAEEPFIRQRLHLHEVAAVLGRCLPMRLQARWTAAQGLSQHAGMGKRRGEAG